MESVYSTSPIPAIPAKMVATNQRHVTDSMLAYTERMREISRFRNDSRAFQAAEMTSQREVEWGKESLEVQARRIPKHRWGMVNVQGKGETTQSSHT